ncbi:MAG: hypothetical protein KH415_18935 [Clostridium sp.]|nr:hypothetical protein [Clostridium sp.]
MVGGAIIGFVYVMKNINEINNLNEVINQTLGLSDYILLALSIVTVLIFLLIYKVRKKSFKEDLKIVPTTKSNIIFGIYLRISTWLFNIGVLSLVNEVGLFKEHFSIMENILDSLSRGSIFIFLLTVGIIAPFTEEFMFRGTYLRH